MSEKTIKGECSVELIRENEDGSADYAFNFPQEALQALTRLGILTAIQAGIEDAKRLNPEFETAPLETQPTNPYNVKFYYLVRKQAINDVISMFKEEHVLVKERHNYWLSAANMVKDEFLEEDDDRQD